jgi:ABC-2 type transport system permease protein
VSAAHRPKPRHSGFAVIMWSDLVEVLKARWYQLYVGTFVVLMAVFFGFGLSDATVMGFTGLSRTLLTFIQAAMIILPVFVLVTTARTMASDRELGVWEYLLSWPVTLRGYYWGKTVGRMAAIALPLALAVAFAGVAEAVRGGQVPWVAVAWTIGLMVALAVFCVGAGVLISVVAASQEMALGTAFALWLVIEALIDSLLLGLLVKQRLPPELLLTLALLNPIQAFRTAGIAVFDPNLTVLGPISYTLLEMVGRTPLLIWSIVWPVAVGVACAIAGAMIFVRKDTTA